MSKWTGDVTYREAISRYNNYFASNDWVPGMNELVDIGEFSFKYFSSHDLMNLASYMETIYKENKISSVKIAIYCPKIVQLGMANAYSTWADGSPETIKIFSDITEAKKMATKRELT